MKLGRTLTAGLVLVLLAGCKEATAPRLPEDDEDDDSKRPPAGGESMISPPAAPVVYA
jgi:hypothetical protein